MVGTKASKVLLCCVLVFVTDNAGIVLAQDDGNIESGLIEDLADVQEELGEADVPLTRQQLEDILALDTRASSSTDISARSPFEGFLGWRHQWSSTAGSAWSCRTALKGKGLQLRLRKVTRSTGNVETGGFLVYEHGNLAMGVGDFGMNHGFGLLKAGPGRGAYLAADNKLGMKRQGTRHWSGGYDSGVVRGASVNWRSGKKWDAMVILGSINELNQEPSPQPFQEKMVRVGGAIRGTQWGLLFASSGSDRGLSLTCSAAGRGVHASMEVARWNAGPGNHPAMAWVMELGLDSKSPWILEGLVVATDGTGFFSGGQLPFLPSGEGGRGWFIRGGRRVSGTGRFLVIAGKMKHRTPTGTGQRHNSTLLDIQGNWRPKTGVEISCRWRRRQKQSETWSSDYPWQAPFVAGQELRSVLSGQINLKVHPLKIRVMSRLYQQGKDSYWGTRSLVSVSATYWLGPGASFQGSNSTSWGDPIDLVSAISPMAGLVLPRHWGSWREETTLGFRFTWNLFQGRLGVSRRMPENWAATGAVTSLWGEASIKW